MARKRYLKKKSLAETLRLFVEECPIPERRPQHVPVEESLGRVTAEPVIARASVPHYHGAAMDGIAVRADSRPVKRPTTGRAPSVAAATSRASSWPCTVNGATFEESRR